ncbi:DUF6933 domain-containing protein [Agarivorans sp. MS3-6]|uniref:DUF6933 domain-containing protein n=1 Tax=Agarivorans sp. TSD2052 TaxID=2937286 RepID=UPI002010B1F9|nr:hypothetical protein [Agarivorans sp. TSD2052]UPW17852.1 hypothetical protein M0C34_16675 [Agarivorans sp. TSD2052]
MIELQISNDVQACLPRELPSLENASVRHSWSAHAFAVGRHECLAVIERASGYVMLFFNLSQDDYQHFARVWQLRVLTEAIAVADLQDEEIDALKQNMLADFQNVLVTDGVNHPVAPQLAKVKALVLAMAKREAKIPQQQMDEFRWGVILNDYAQRQAGLSPYQKMQQQWQAMAASAQCRQLAAKPATKMVIH